LIDSDTIETIDSISEHVIKYGIYRDSRISDKFIALVPKKPGLARFSLNESKKEIIFFLCKSYVLDEKPALSEIYLSIGIFQTMPAHRSLNDLCRTGLIIPVADGEDRRRTLYAVSNQFKKVLDEFLDRYRREFYLLLPSLDGNRKKLAHGDPDLIGRLVLNAETPIMIHAEDGEIVAISQKWLEISGYSEKDLPTVDAWLEKAYGKDAGRNAKIIAQRFNSNSGSSHLTDTVETASGVSRIWRFLHTFLGEDDRGRGVLMTVVEDISEKA
jgi:PAS domain S-box-containing protein